MAKHHLFRLLRLTRHPSQEIDLCLHLLVSHAADLTAKDNNGETLLLHCAARTMQALKLIPDLLVGHGLDVHAANSDGQTALHVFCGSITVVGTTKMIIVPLLIVQ